MNQTLAELAAKKVENKAFISTFYSVQMDSLIYYVNLLLLYNKNNCFGGKILVILRNLKKLNYYFKTVIIW